MSGFRENRWQTAQKVAKGDYLLCYLAGVSRFIGILEVTSKPYKDTEQKIWGDDGFPCRFKVKPIVELIPETAIPVKDLSNQLSCFQNMKSPHAWTGRFRKSPSKWTQPDGKAVVQALLDAYDNPVKRPFDKKKLQYRPKHIRAKTGSVTVPESSGDEPEPEIKRLIGGRGGQSGDSTLGAEFTLLEQLHQDPTAKFYNTHAEEFKQKLEQPFKQLLAAITAPNPTYSG